jgi:hypothetical protein
LADNLSRQWARRIIEVVGAHGIPPEWGSNQFSVGLDPWLDVMARDYLDSYVGEDGGAAFKLVVGAYGGGKTHFLYNMRDLAWRRGFVVAYVPLSKDETPFHRMELVYAAVARTIAPPQGPEDLAEGGRRGLGAIIDQIAVGLKALKGEALEAEIESRLASIENLGFLQAMRRALTYAAQGDHRNLEQVLGFLMGQDFDRKFLRNLGLSRGIDRSNAFSMLRSLVQFLRAFNYRGLVVLFDEAELLPSLSSREKQNLLANLRELVDSCGNNQFQNVMFFYAVPDYSFFDGKLNVYEALKQRLGSVFDFDNPTGVSIELERTLGDPETALRQIGSRLLAIYQTAYDWKAPGDMEPQIQQLAKEAFRRRGGEIGYKRLFVKSAVRLFHGARAGKLLNATAEELADLLLQGGAA